IEEILPPLIVRPPHEPHNMPTGVQIERARFSHQLHARLSRELVPLAPVARMAAGNQIFPRRRTSTRSWNHVVKRQLARRQHSPAVLAGIAIAQQDLLARSRESV